MSVSNWRRNAQLFTALTTTDTTVGIYVKRDGELDQVNVGESTVSVKSTTRYRPSKGEPVVLTWTNGRLRLTGPARTKSSTGKITAVGYPKVTVLCDEKTYQIWYSTRLIDQLEVGDNVAIDWEYDGGYVKDVATGSGTDGNQEPVITKDQKPFTLYFFAKQSGSRKTINPPGKNTKSYQKWWTQDVYADDDNVAGWFYGNVIRKSLKDDAYISSVEIYLPVRKTKGKTLPKIGRHTKDTRPKDSESLSVQDEHTRKARSGWVRLPTEWAEGWRDSPGGVGVNHGGNTVYKGIQADRQSGKLRIKGRQ